MLVPLICLHVRLHCKCSLGSKCLFCLLHVLCAPTTLLQAPCRTDCHLHAFCPLLTSQNGELGIEAASTLLIGWELPVLQVERIQRLQTTRPLKPMHNLIFIHLSSPELRCLINTTYFIHTGFQKWRKFSRLASESDFSTSLMKV